ncbi:YlxM family DNA-binding protein [Cohnella sp. REN36]|uniref:YlxM family DNA-binding protein n=1 Tax=Cohnella sp. REN36 TaxID=2887347 RepID=UPI001D14EAB3|nr:YlxM family DNA-binding protein [Cohnella sp. REN36]
MHGDNALAKTTRVNILFDFYGPLLTEKQQTFLKYYFHDDYSLGEIAADAGVSRQAVYEHLKRAEQVLESYERKLGLVSRHERLQEGLSLLERQIDALPDEWRRKLAETATMLRGSE